MQPPTPPQQGAPSPYSPYNAPGQGPAGYGPQQGPAGAAPNKGKNRGCWIVAFSGCGLLLVLMAVGSYLLYQATKDAPVADIVWAVGEGAEAINEARSAPGTNALRKEGCTEAMAIDFARFGKIAERFDAGVPKTSEIPNTVVSCTLGFMKESQGVGTCHHLAKVYLDGGGLPGRQFMLSVNKSGRNQSICNELYQEDGTHVPSDARGSQ